MAVIPSLWATSWKQQWQRNSKELQDTLSEVKDAAKRITAFIPTLRSDMDRPLFNESSRASRTPLCLSLSAESQSSEA